MNTSREFIEKINAIRKRLPHKAQKLIAKQTGKSYSYVTKVLRGELYGPEVIEMAIKIIKEQEATDNRVNDKINQTV